MFETFHSQNQAKFIIASVSNYISKQKISSKFKHKQCFYINRCFHWTIMTNTQSANLHYKHTLGHDNEESFAHVKILHH